MKKLTFCLFILSCMAVHGQWKQSFTSQPELVRNISVVNDDIVWVKDQTGGYVSVTTDGGKNWATKPFSAEITAATNGGLCAVNATTAYTVVSQTSLLGVYKTMNSGYTWTRQATAFNDPTSFPDFIYFWNELEGVTVGDALADGYFDIYTTSNGGAQWNKVTGNLPSTPVDYTYNTNTYFRVHGNTFFFLTVKGKILKSTDKGLTWSLINTPLGINFVSFDFKDDLHGLLKSLDNQLYSTSNGGIDWTLIGVGSCYANIVYNQTKNVYLSSQTGDSNKQTWYGLSYSKDDGMTWTIQSGFKNVGVEPIGISSSGKMFAGGWQYVYRTDNYEGVNLSVLGAEIKSPNSMDVFYSTKADALSSQDTTNYDIGYIDNRIFKGIKIHTITQDPTDKSIVHVVFDSTLPLDTIKIYVSNVFENNGTIDFPVLNSYSNNVVLYNFKTPRTVNVNVAGTLSTLLTASELSSLDTLIITGTIDARDFKTIRDNMPLISVLDVSRVSIAAYTGTDGPSISNYIKYPENSIPIYAFYNPNTAVSKVGLKILSLPLSITSIGSYSFDGCTGLTGTLVIPNSVTSIGTNAFAYCSGISGFTLSNTLSMIGEAAFFNCTGLSTISIPGSVTSIGLRAFNWCFALTQFNVESGNQIYSSIDGVLFNKYQNALIQFPGGKGGIYSVPSPVQYIETYAFYGCNNLTKLTLPTSVSYIGSRGLGYCNLLSDISVASDNPYLSSVNGVLFNKLQTELIQCPAGKSGVYTVPNTVASIREGGFIRCNKLTGVVIPNSVSSIDTYTFYNCTSLTSVTMPTAISFFGDYAFNNCTALTSLTIPGVTRSIGNYAFANCSNLNSINANPGYPVDLASISGVFSGVNLNTCILNVPYKSKALYAAASQWSDFINIVENSQGFLLGTNQLNLSSLAGSIPVSIQANVNWRVISDQSWVTVSPDSGTGDKALTVAVLANPTNFERFATITVSSDGIPSQILSVKQSGIPKTISVTAGNLATVLTPSELDGISDLTVTGTIDARDFKTMRDKMPVLVKIDLTGVNIQAYVGNEGTGNIANTSYPENEIPQDSFYPKDNLTSVLLPVSINSIGSGAFMYCNSLNSINISSSITHIGDFAFDACSADINVDPANPTYSSVEGVLFDKNKTSFIQCPTTKTGSYMIPSTVNSIELWAFENCINLTSIIIPASVQIIKDGAFYFASGLTSIYSYSTVPVDLSLNTYVFDGINKTICILHVPKGSKSAYQAALFWKDFLNIEELITSVPVIDNTTIRLYPNPATDGFYVNGIEGTFLLYLFDINGRMLITEKVTDNKLISVGTLTKGIYVVKIITKEGTIERKLVKK